MDRLPLPAPFAVGTRVRYLGELSTYADASLRQPLFKRGMEFEIIETRPGRRGTLRQARDKDGPMFYDDTNEPILDTTRDGYSIYCLSNGQRRLIDPENASEWETILKTPPAASHPTE